jgi:hypothetical protein
MRVFRLCRSAYPKKLSGLNAFEISDIQEEKLTQANRTIRM